MIPPSVVGQVIVREASWDEDQTWTCVSMSWRADVRRAGVAGVVKAEAGRRSGVGLIGAIGVLVMYEVDEDDGVTKREEEEERTPCYFLTA